MESRPVPSAWFQPTEMLQDCPAPRVEGQSLVWENGPEVVMPVMVSGVLAVLVRVSV
jgi:hypothetical protein